MSRGLTVTVLKPGGTRPEVLMVLVIVGMRTLRFLCSYFVEMGLRSYDLETVFWRISETNCFRKISLVRTSVAVSRSRRFCPLQLLG